MKLIRRRTFSRMRQRLAVLYGEEQADQLAERLYMMVGRYGVCPAGSANHPTWSERDTVLITYADMVRDEASAPLQVLGEFCRHRFDGLFQTIHLLPFFPSSSDGGFSVVHYRRVDPAVGTWDDVRALARDWGLAMDLVLNHCSRRNPMFRSYVQGLAPEKNYFIEQDPSADLSRVVRPRVTPLLTATETSGGPRHVWTTFSADQIDLNWRCPDVLFEFLDILLFLVSHGARMLRLDAVAFLWKEPGTDCLHRPQTHEIVKFLHDFLMVVAPHVVLLTETNVPHRENISYFGEGDEAHMVYQFSLPPLLLHALLRGEARTLAGWLKTHGNPPAGCTFLNFTASHDGIGLRPLEGLVPDREIDWLVEQTTARGGRIGSRRLPDGHERPYELNIAWRDAVDVPGDPEGGLRRFRCSQAVMLALRGIPAVWFHNIVGTRNWNEGGLRGEARDINRRRWNLPDLEAALVDPATGMGRILQDLAELLRVRRSHRAFHPKGGQEIFCPSPGVLGIARTSPGGRQRVLCWFNLGGEAVSFPARETAAFLGTRGWVDLLATDSSRANDRTGLMPAWDVRWCSTGGAHGSITRRGGARARGGGSLEKGGSG